MVIYLLSGLEYESQDWSILQKIVNFFQMFWVSFVPLVSLFSLNCRLENLRYLKC